MENKEHIVEGRKTFFIAPNTMALPQSFLADYLASGFEAYFVVNDKICPLEKKIATIVSVFPHSILFFFVDTIVPGVVWPTLIRTVFARHKDRALFGVMYMHKQSEKDKREIVQLYERDIGLQCRSVQLEHKKDANFAIVKKALTDNDALGRRKAVRAVLSGNCTVAFDLKDEHYSGKVVDISMSHFSCIITRSLPIPLGTHIDEARLNIRGMHFKCQAALIMQRETPRGVLYVFMLVLDVFTSQLLIPKLYEIMDANCSAVLDELYYSRGNIASFMQPVG